jgi:hypothetical protein
MVLTSSKKFVTPARVCVSREQVVAAVLPRGSAITQALVKVDEACLIPLTTEIALNDQFADTTANEVVNILKLPVVVRRKMYGNRLSQNYAVVL